MFLGVYRVAVAADGSIALPPRVADALVQQGIVFEVLTLTNGRVILAWPGIGDSGRPAIDGRVQLPPPLLAEAGISDTAELHGMGEYLIIRAPG